MNIGNKVRIKIFEEGKGSYLKPIRKMVGSVIYICKDYFVVQAEKYRESFKFIDEVCGDIRIEVLN